MQRTALITGAGGGIGRAAALALAADGFAVALAGRRRAALEETASLAGDATTLAIPTDVTDKASVDALFAAIQQHWGRLDVLFNNAGGSSGSTNFGDLSDQQWDSVVAVNLTGVFRVARGAFRMMRDQSPQGGRIINNGSISAHAPRPGSAPYTATKHGVSGLTKTISLDGRRFNIACGQVDVGNAGTDMTARMRQGVPQANGTVAVEPVMDVANVARSVGADGLLATRRQYPEPDRHGDRHALRRPGLMPMHQPDVVVIGGGVAGLSIAWRLAAAGASVTVLEAEAQCGFHSSGRSAAMLTENYGPPSVRALTAASRAFLAAPPDGFSEAPLLRRRGSLTVARADQAALLEAELAHARQHTPHHHRNRPGGGAAPRPHPAPGGRRPRHARAGCLRYRRRRVAGGLPSRPAWRPRPHRHRQSGRCDPA